MLLRALELESIRSYRHARIEFPVGRTLLSGDIGAGKSTILLAIEFALFGLVRGWNDGDKLLRHGAATGKVRLEADLDGSFAIERSLKRSSSGIQQEEVVIEDERGHRRVTPSEARSIVVERLGYPSEFSTKQPVLFRYTVFTPQEAMKQIVDERPEARLDAIRKIFGIDRYERIASNAQTVSRALRQRAAVLSGRLERKAGVVDDLARIKAERARLAEDLEAASKADVEARSALGEATKELDSARTAVERERSKRELATRIREERAELASELEALIVERSQLEIPERVTAPPTDVASLENSLVEIDERIAGLDGKIATARDERSGLEKLDVQLASRLERSRESIERLEAQRTERDKSSQSLEAERERFGRFDADAVRRELDKHRTTAEELAEERTRLAERIRHARGEIEAMPHEGPCPTCGQPIDREHRTRAIGKLESSIEAATLRRRQLAERSKQVEQKRAELEERVRRFEAFEARAAALPNDPTEALEQARREEDKLASNRAQTGERIAAASRRVEELAEERTQLSEERRTKAGQIRAAREAQLRIEREARARERASAITARIAAIRGRDERLEAQMPKIDETATAKLDAATSDHAQAQKVAAESAALLERLGERASGLDERRAALAKELDELRLLESEKAGLESTGSFLTGPVPDLASQVESAVMRRILIETNDHFSKWFSILVEDLEAYLDDGFTPRIVQSGYDVSFDDLSGGERTSVALAFRLALHEAINHLTGRSSAGLLILDEPTEGFSTEQLVAVRDVLAQLRSEQIIIVSHEQQVESFVDRTIRIEKSEQESEVS